MSEQNVSNIIHGDVTGYVVQARDIHGDVYFPEPSPKFPRFAGVPPRVTNLVGREGDLGRLRQQLGSTSAVVVTGLGGVGKTALLTEFCHRHRPDFQLIRWIVASSREATIGALLSLASALNIDTARLTAEDAIRAGYEVLGASDGHWLLVFDNVDQPGWINDLLPVEQNASVVITSRRRDWADEGLAALPLGTISAHDSVALLTAITGREPDDASTRLATRLAGLSLAVRQAATYCARTHCDFATYLRLLDERGMDMYQRDAALKAVLETSLEQVGELAGAILHVCAFLPPADIRADLFLGAFASNESLLRHGDEILVRDALSALEQYSLLDRTFHEAGRPARFGVHRLIQQLCRTSAGDHREKYAQTAMRLMRRSGTGWDYYVADSGAAVVGVERGTGRLLLTRTSNEARTELPLPPDAVDLPLSVEVDDSRVTARYPYEVAVWTFDEHAVRRPGPTHMLVDRLLDGDSSVRLPDGRVLDVLWPAAPLRLALDGVELSRTLDPGWRGMRFLQAPPLIDPAGQWLVVSIYTTKIIDCGWIAAWLLEDVLAEDGAETLEAVIQFDPNVTPSGDDDEEYAGEPVKSLCFSADNSRLYLLDERTIHAWTWSVRDYPRLEPLWRISRPERQVEVLDAALGAPVRCCTSLVTGVIRTVLTDGRVVDIRPQDLRTVEVGDCVNAVAISPVDGSVLTSDSGVVRAFGIDDGAFLGRTDDGRLVRVDPTGLLTDLGQAPGDLLAVHRSGTAVLVRDGDELRHLAVTGQSTREVNHASMCRTSDTKTPFLTPVAFATADLPISVCDCHQAHNYDNDKWWSLGGCSTPPNTTAVAADAGTAVVGSGDGRVTLWIREGRQRDFLSKDDAKRFSVSASTRPIRWLVPRLDIRVVVAIDDDGHVAGLGWG